VPIVTEEQQRFRRRSKWPVRLGLAAGALLLALPLVPLFVRVEAPMGRTYWMVLTIQDPYTGGPPGFRHSSGWGGNNTDLWALRIADWEYRVWRSERSD
jgi:hypothetical protein